MALIPDPMPYAALGSIINGNRFVADPNMTEGKLVEEPRSWKERLLTLPWQPMKKTKFKSIEVPSRQVVVIDGTYYAHPALIEEIRQLTLKETE